MKKWNLYTTNEIKPRGWLKKQLEIQAEGLCGNLDKIWPDIRNSAWIGGDKEGWERVPYWLDGFIPLAYLLENEDMINRAKKYIDAIISFQKKDGWICPCKDEERKTYDTWAVQLISKTLTVYYECSKDERIPEVLYNVLKNYYEMLRKGEIKLFDWGEARWFECFIAIGFVYERFSEEWLTDLARILKSQGLDYEKYTENWKRPLNRWSFPTHIVNIGMMLKSEAVSHVLLNEEYTDKAERLYEILKKYNGTAVELFTGDECLSGLSPIQGTELCSVVEQMYSYELLFAYTGENKWAERLETIAFNALPATISDDMWTHQYDQMSNQISCQRFQGKPIFRTNGGESHLFGLEPNYGCCTANFNQGWPKFALSAFMHNENRIINSVPVPCELKSEYANIVLETDYPFNNSFKYSINSKKPFEFIIRIPSFAQNVIINNRKSEASEFSVKTKANEKMEINVSFDIKPYYVPRPNGLNAVKCGSLVFSVPVSFDKKMLEYERDGVERKYPYCDYELSPKSDWNYAYTGAEFSVSRHKITDTPFSSANPPVTVATKAVKIDWGCEDGYDNVCAKIPESRKAVGSAEDIILYPYGCTKLRMTELPFYEK